MATAMSLGSASCSEEEMTSSIDEESSRLEAMSLSEQVSTPLLSPEEAEIIGSSDLNSVHMIKTIGVGTFGNVRLCRLDGLERPFAIKIMSKSKLIQCEMLEGVMNERQILQEYVRHPFVMQLYKTYADEQYIYMLQEFVPGGDMFLHLQVSHRLSRDAAQFHTAQIVLVFEYLHSIGVVYRDLKPENLLISQTGYLKVADFGFSRRMTPGEKLRTKCGTPEYLAPEIIKDGTYGLEVDWWALGILIFELLVGHTPFCGDTSQQTFTNIMSGQVAFPADIDHVTRDIIMRFLRGNPAERFGCFQEGAVTVKRHRFFQGIVWSQLYQGNIPAPLVPKLDSPFDSRYFEEYTDEECQLPLCEPLSVKEHELFADFSQGLACDL
jgi:serine/threonine protein kinase